MIDDDGMHRCHSIEIRGGVYRPGEGAIEIVLEHAFRLKFTLAEAEDWHQRLGACIETTRTFAKQAAPAPQEGE